MKIDCPALNHLLCIGGSQSVRGTRIALAINYNQKDGRANERTNERTHALVCVPLHNLFGFLVRYEVENEDSDYKEQADEIYCVVGQM